jgi:hypothetical protein
VHEQHRDGRRIVTGRHLDLDALRAARGEALGVSPTITFFGETFKLPAQLPFAVIEAFAIDDAHTIHAGAVSLLGEDGVTLVVAKGATVDDISDLMQMVTHKLYGGADPEA